MSAGNRRGGPARSSRRRPDRHRRPGRRPNPPEAPRPSVAQRLETVDRLLAGTVTDAGGLWPRATAWILRIALEQLVDELWARVAPELMRCPMRAQLLALRAFTGPFTAARIATLWSALSHATHHHDYELAPGATELRRWREETAAIAADLSAVR
ncbi:hypothetical protein [Nocardia donostiensis]|uniref:hypothetical protein n=1 Tax=Nocardia donostiensis TaxID=1538463 RepID=UPI001FE7B4BC|nr:hypothetical protein [Nocardia donostiensis]